MIIVGVAVSWQSGRRAAQQAEQLAADTVQTTALALALPMTSEDIAGTREWTDHLVSAVTPRLTSGEVLTVHIWQRVDATRGRILWSTSEQHAGKVVPLGGAAVALDTGQAVVEKLHDGTQSEGSDVPNLYEIYQPFHDRTGTAYVLEVYKQVGNVETIRTQLLWDWLPLSLGGVLLLAAVTFPLSLGLARSAAAAERDRAAFADQALRARAEEHRRISEVLHERTVQDLSAARLILEASRRSSASSEVGNAVDSAIDRLATDVAELRRLLSTGEATEWQAEDLATALSGWVATLPDPGKVELDLPATPWPLHQPEVAVALRVIKESVRNAVKHAHAQHIHVEGAAHDGWLAVTVTDDGDGIDDPVASGLGLQIMRYASRSVGGSILLKSTAGAGTTMQLRLPTTDAAAGRRAGRRL